MSQKSFDSLVSVIDGMSVLELSKVIKMLEEHYGVSAAQVASVAHAGDSAQAGAAAAAKSEYKVILKEGGAETIKVIKALRGILSNLGLAEAKAAVVEGNFVVAEAANVEEAKKMKAALEEAGAKVELS